MESVGDGWEEMTAVDAVPSRPLADGAPSTSLACADVIVRTPYVRFAYKGMHGVVYRSAYYALLRSESCPYYYTPLLRVVRSERGPAVDTEALMAGYVRLTLWVEYDPPDSHPAILDAIRRRLHPRNRRVVTEADLRPMHMRSVVWSFRDEGAELAGAARYPLSMADRPRSPGDRLPMRIMVHGEEAARRARCLMERSPIAMHIAHDVRWVRVHDASERVDAHLAVSDFSLEVTNVHLLASRAWARFWERASRSLAVRTLLASARTMESTAKACGPADRTSFSPGCDRHVMLNTPATAFWGALHEMARAFCIEITDRLGLDLCPAGATFRSVMNRVMHHLRASVEHCVLWDRPSPLADDGRLDTRPCTVQHLNVYQERVEHWLNAAFGLEGSGERAPPGVEGAVTMVRVRDKALAFDDDGELGWPLWGWPRSQRSIKRELFQRDLRVRCGLWVEFVGSRIVPTKLAAARLSLADIARGHTERGMFVLRTSRLLTLDQAHGLDLFRESAAPSLVCEAVLCPFGAERPNRDHGLSPFHGEAARISGAKHPREANASV